jgi:hypothetical protein
MGNKDDTSLIKIIAEELGVFDIQVTKQLERIKNGEEWNALGKLGLLRQQVKTEFKEYEEIAYKMIKNNEVEKYLDTCRSELNEMVSYIGAEQKALKEAGKDYRMIYENNEYNNSYNLFEQMQQDFKELVTDLEKTEPEEERQ